MSLVTVSEQAPIQIDQGRILRALKLDPNDPNTQALLLVCQRYDLDPVLRHMVLISGNPYITRDGLLHVAHASGQFDGIEVVDEGEDDDVWWAKVSVYRKDMGRPFTYRGRYPKKTAGHMAKYGVEMAVKVAEVMALRRAFDVGGIGAADEQWDAVDVAEVMQIDPEIMAAFDALPEQARAKITRWARRQSGVDDLEVYDLPAEWVPALQQAIEVEGQRARDAEPVDAEIVDEASPPDAAGVAETEPTTGDEAADPLAAEGSGAVAGTPEPDAAREGPAPTQKQNGMLHALLKPHDFTDEERRQWASVVLGRPIESFKTLSRDDVKRLIDDLQGES